MKMPDEAKKLGTDSEVKVGDWILIISTTNAYVSEVCQVSPEECALIDVTSGNRWDDMTEVPDNKPLKLGMLIGEGQQEYYSIDWHEAKEWVEELRKDTKW
jgi:hypothetical protein